MRTLLITLSLFAFTLTSLGQTELDSLISVWEDETQSDSMRAEARFIIASTVSRTNQDSAMGIRWELLQFGQDQNCNACKALACRGIGYSFYQNRQIDSAEFYYLEAVNLAEKANMFETLAKVNYNLIWVYHNTGEKEKAKDAAIRAAEAAEKAEMWKRQADALQQLGGIYETLGEGKKALESLQRALVLAEKLNDTTSIAFVNGTLGLVHYRQGETEKALDYILISVDLLEKTRNEHSLGVALGNLAMVYDSQKRYDEAMKTNEKALAISRKLGDTQSIAITLMNMGIGDVQIGSADDGLIKIKEAYDLLKNGGDAWPYNSAMKMMGLAYAAKGDHRQAADWCLKALEHSKKVELLPLQMDNLKCVYEAFEDMSKYKEALEYYRQYKITEDSLFSEDRAKEFARQETQFEYDKKILADSIAQAEEARIVEEAHQEEVRQKNKTRNVLAVIGLLALLLAIGFYSRWRYVTKSRNVIAKEKDRSEKLLLNILPAEIAEELKENGRADARDFELVSILFTDFKGFTAASEKMSAHDLVFEINACFEAFDGIMGKYGIEKIKTIGDAYMAAGGLPVPTNDSVKSTVLAALEMQAFISKHKAEMDVAGKPAFEMRVGIHTGPVVAGIVGVKKFAYDIWGDTVNTASRMESSGAVGQVNISQSTYEMLKDDADFKFEGRGKIEAKGKGEIEMYFVTK